MHKRLLAPALLALLLAACAPVVTGPSTPSTGCCRVCTVGKPCGDTCIAAGKTCHTPGGCACSAQTDGGTAAACPAVP
ncbi:MAG TPA: hypothetical protein VHN99_08140 [Deinococcales bacterium]|nr:hypothetical protein [Deinococcales bacterium]